MTASKLWRLVPDFSWTQQRTTDHTRKHRPDRVGGLTLCAHDLWVLHKRESPEPLQGDRRTSKSNALKAADGIRGLAAPPTFKHQSETFQSTDAKTADTVGGFDDPHMNPNRGVGFSMRRKILGLPAEWETTIQIERYVLHAKLSPHFLVCPVCGIQQRVAAGQRPGVEPHETHHPSPTPARCAAAIRLPGRVTKLYLPLCTEREWEDARVAHLWLASHPAPSGPTPPTVACLLERYAELFPGRKPRCRRCLGLRYGEVK